LNKISLCPFVSTSVASIKKDYKLHVLFVLTSVPSGSDVNVT
jgi:hypothetical protein